MVDSGKSILALIQAYLFEKVLWNSQSSLQKL